MSFKEEIDYFAWSATLVSDQRIMGGATCFPGTRLTVNHIGLLVKRGVAEEELLDDYPYLTPTDLKHALKFVEWAENEIE